MDEHEAVNIAKAKLKAHERANPPHYRTVAVHVDVLRALIERATRAHD